MGPITPIDPADLPRLGLDPEHNLYWDSKLINTTTSLVLTSPQSKFARYIVAAAFAASLATIANATASWFTYTRNGRLAEEQKQERAAAAKFCTTTAAAASKPIPATQNQLSAAKLKSP